MNVGLLLSDAPRDDQIARLLRVLETKVRVGHLLAPLQEFRVQAAAHRGDVLDAPAEPASLPLEKTVVAPPRISENLPNPEESTVVDQIDGRQPAVGEGGEGTSPNTEKLRLVDHNSGPWPGSQTRGRDRKKLMDTEESKAVDQKAKRRLWEKAK